MLAPALDPVVRQPELVDLLQPRHHLGARALHDDEVLLIATAAARRAAWPILLPGRWVCRGVLNGAGRHLLLPAACIALILAQRAIGGATTIVGRKQRNAAALAPAELDLFGAPRKLQRRNCLVLAEEELVECVGRLGGLAESAALVTHTTHAGRRRSSMPLFALPMPISEQLVHLSADRARALLI
eukprot:2965043-Prymnesium_polylepis.2